MRVKGRPAPWEMPKVQSGLEGAKRVREKLEELLPEGFTIKILSVNVESMDIPITAKVKSEHLDYGIFHKGKKIAEFDTTLSNYTFAGSRIMPVRFYKGDLIKTVGVPTFMVYCMKKETGPIEERCYWILGENVVKCEHRSEYLGGKWQDNYFTDKGDWHRGLASFIQALLSMIQGGDCK